MTDLWQLVDHKALSLFEGLTIDSPSRSASMFRAVTTGARLVRKPFESLGWLTPRAIRPQSGVQIPEPLHYNPQDGVLILSDLGPLIPVATIFSLLNRHLGPPGVTSPSSTGAKNRTNPSTLTSGPSMTLEKLAAGGCNVDRFFQSIGQTLGTFLARLHEPGLRRGLIGPINFASSRRWASHSKEVELSDASIRLANQRLCERMRHLEGSDGEFERLTTVLLADNSRNDHPKE